MLNISYRKIGGVRFLKLGRLTLSMCVTAEYRPIRRRQRDCTVVFPGQWFPADRRIEAADTQPVALPLADAAE